MIDAFDKKTEALFDKGREINEELIVILNELSHEEALALCGTFFEYIANFMSKRHKIEPKTFLDYCYSAIPSNKAADS